MIIQSPKIFNGVKCDNGPLVVFPIAIFVVFEKPKCPRVLKKKNQIINTTKNLKKIQFRTSPIV